MKIDKVIIINLKHRTDRKENIIKELQRVGIKNYEFYNANKPCEEDINKWNPNFLNPIPAWFEQTGGDNIKYKIGSLGCMLSHINIIKNCIEQNYENVLILEDDTMFNIGNGISLQQILYIFKNQIDNLDFGLLYLAGNHRGSVLEKKTENIMKVKGTLTTGSYIINKKVMNFIVKNSNHFPREIDVFYSNYVQTKFPCYCITPHLTRQEKGYSDIVQQHVSYDL